MRQIQTEYKVTLLKDYNHCFLSTDAILPRGVGHAVPALAAGVALSILLLVRHPASGEYVDRSDPRRGSDDGGCEPLVIGVARSGLDRQTVLFCIYQIPYFRE